MKFTKRMWLICLFSALFLLAAGAAGFARGRRLLTLFQNDTPPL